MTILCQVFVSMFLLCNSVPLLGAFVPAKRESKRISVELAQEMVKQKMNNLVSSHTAAFGKDNLIKSGVKDSEFQGWENAVQVIVDGSPLADDLQECSMQMKVIITQAHLKLVPMFKGEEIDRQDMANFLHEKQRIIDGCIKTLEALPVQDNELFKNVKNFEIATFNKINKEMNKLLLTQSKVITTIKSDLPLIKKGLTVVKKSELEDKIAAIKKNTRENVNGAFDQIGALFDQVKANFGFWLDSEYIEIPEYTADNQKKYLEKIKIADAMAQTIQASLMSLQLGKLDDTAKQTITDLLNLVTSIKRELQILQSALQASKTIG